MPSENVGKAPTPMCHFNKVAKVTLLKSHFLTFPGGIEINQSLKIG